jgi:hypothetical protein
MSLHFTRYVQIFLMATTALFGCQSNSSNRPEGEPLVMLVHEPQEEKVGVYISGRLFTSYLYPTGLEKPVLYPIYSPTGEPVTRGFPLDPRAGERTDHPHHLGAWMNYGDVNGLDFWNNYKIAPEKKRQYGNVKHIQVLEAASGEEGLLKVQMHWTDQEGKVLLVENTTFRFFQLSPEVWGIDRVSALTTQKETVSLKDNKEGLFAIRVHHALEMPDPKPVARVHFGEEGGEALMPDTLVANGNYLNSEGITGHQVWSKKARWCMLHGKVQDRPVFIALLDHPSNPGYPAHWHARGYGLFAVNHLGAAAFTNGETVINYALSPGQSVTFRLRMLFGSGEAATAQTLDQWQNAFGN